MAQKVEEMLTEDSFRAMMEDEQQPTDKDQRLQAAAKEAGQLTVNHHRYVVVNQLGPEAYLG